MTAAHDIGELSGPILVFGGPYSNLQALQAMRQKAVELGVAPENCICTGDIVAYCADPIETVALMRDWGIRTIQGNCEESLASKSIDCGCGFDVGSQCDILSKQWFGYASQALNHDSLQWMHELPPQLTFKFNTKRFHVLHGGASNISRFVFHSTPVSTFLCEFAKLECDVVLAGHCGVPFTKAIGDKYWHNAGVIGMPANDGTPDVWYSLIKAKGNSGIKISHHRLSYDFIGAADAMFRAGLSQSYANGLTGGLWPNMDVMPELERKQVGKRLDESVHII